MPRITEHNGNPRDFAVQWNDDSPDKWYEFDHMPTDEDLDAACKECGLWEPGQVYPYFVIWFEGTDVAAGGGPNSGIME